jgi:cystathionine beta-lyase/cystathionine gamma-synthase
VSFFIKQSSYFFLNSGIMTHASLPLESRNKLGINDNFLRLSVGIEDSDDLVKDLEQALEKAVNKFKTKSI